MNEEISEVKKDMPYEQARIDWENAKKEVETRIHDATKWILHRQDEEGYWGEESPWTTGLVLRALSLAKDYSNDIENHAENSLIKAVDWLEKVSQKPSYNLRAWDVELGTYDTSIVVRGLISCGYRESELVERSIKWLVHEASGRWYGRSETAIWEYFPAQMIIALKESGVSENRDLNKIAYDIIESLKKMQRRDGSWGNEYDTPEILEAIIAFYGKKCDSVQSALEWIKSKQTEKGNWGGLPQITSKILNTWIMGHNEPCNETTAQALAWLIGTQHSNGSWFHQVEDTAFTVVALCKVLSIVDFRKFSQLSPFLPFPNIDYRYIRIKPEIAELEQEIARLRKWLKYILLSPLVLVLLYFFYLFYHLFAKLPYFLLGLIGTIVFEISYSILFYLFIQPRIQKTSKWRRPFH